MLEQFYSFLQFFLGMIGFIFISYIFFRVISYAVIKSWLQLNSYLKKEERRIGNGRETENTHARNTDDDYKGN